MSRSLLLIVLIALLFLPSGEAFSQQWCPQAKSDDEVEICSRISLSRREIYLTDLFAKLRQKIARKDDLLEIQRNWLKQRSQCRRDEECIRVGYDQVIEIYQGIARQASVPYDQPDYYGYRIIPSFPSVPPKPETTGPLPAGKVGIQQINLSFDSKSAVGNRMDALIVANGNYTNVDDLKTPLSDARLVADALKTKGIASTVKSDIDGPGLDKALSAFEKSTKKDLFIFYYAGHAAEINGKPSLLFPAFKLEGTKSNGEFRPIAEVVSRISKLGYKKILILFDACRNPIVLEQQPGSENSPAQKRQASATIRGLNTHDVDLNELRELDYAISFSAAEGQFAIDTVDGTNSPFAAAFARKLREKNTFFDAIIETRRLVKSTTNQKQHPTLQMSWDEDVTLDTPVIKAITVDLLEPLQVKTRKSSPEIAYKSNSWGGYPLVAVTHHVSEEQDCGLTHQGFGVVTVTFDLGECLQPALGYDVVPDPRVPQRIDDAFETCENADVDLDLNSDGRPEKLSLGFDKFGGRFTFEHDGQKATFYSSLGCNATLSFYDIDQNGIRDVIATFRRPVGREATDAVVVLSGEKLFGINGGTFYPASEPYASLFGRDGRTYVIGGLRKVALYYDEKLKYSVGNIRENVLDFDTYEGTWNKGDAGGIKTVHFNRDGTILLDTSSTFWIRGISEGEFAVDKLN